MKVIEQEYRNANIDDLTLHPENPRKGDIGAIHTSIERNGFYGALTVQKSTGFILTGNHRVQAAQQAGATTVPILEVDCDDETATRIMLADNRTNDLATYDDPALASVLARIAQADGGVDNLMGTGYDGDDLDTLLKDLAAADFKNSTRGDGLEGLDVAMGDPDHVVHRKEAWRVGDANVLVCCNVNTEWELFHPYLVPGSVFAPYPTPMLPILFTKAPLVMVQPDPYLAGHVLDKYASKHGADTIVSMKEEAA